MGKHKNPGPLFFKPARAAKKISQPTRAITVTIDKLSGEGSGIAFVDGKPLFVPNTLPGETVRARIVNDKSDFAEAELLEIVSAAAQRIEPNCAVFGRCGGCQLQMLDIEAQRTHKIATLQHLLQPLLTSVPALDEPIIGEPWHYRHRARLAVTEINGEPALGFKASNSHRVVALRACPILDVRLQPLLRAIPQWLRQLTRWRFIEEIRIAIDSNGVIAVMWSAKRDLPKADIALLDKLCAEQNVRVGAATLTYTVPSQGTEFGFGIDDFTQVNPQVNDRLVARALHWLQPGADEDIADFFCGLGNFTLPLALAAKSVTGYELDAAMVTRAAANARGRSNVAFVALDLFAAPLSIENRSIEDRFDAALLDPPRAGAKVLSEQLAASKRLRRLLYISCNPYTLVRDLGVLTAKGFKVRHAALVDMFPQTGHSEAIVLLARD